MLQHKVNLFPFQIDVQFKLFSFHANLVPLFVYSGKDLGANNVCVLDLHHLSQAFRSKGPNNANFHTGIINIGLQQIK